MAKEEQSLGGPLLAQQHAAPKGTASVWQTTFNIIVSIVGTGMLGLPFAFRAAGWLAGSFVIILAGVSTFYCMLLLVECRKRLQGDGVVEISSYGDLGALAFGRMGRYCTELLVLVSQCGGAVAYLVFIGQNLASIFASHHLGSSSFILLLLTPVEVALSLIRSLSTLSPFSALADVCNVLAIAAVIKRDLQLLHGFLPIRATTTISVLPFALGMAIFCFEGFCMTLPLEASMANPQKFPACLARTFSGITLVYVCFGFFGYAAFGDATMDIVTLNLPDGWSSTAVKLGLCVALVFTFPIMMHPIHDIVEAKLRDVGSNSSCRWFFSWLTRGLTVVALAVVASFVPGFGMFMSLVGSTVCAMLSFVLPAAVHLKLGGPGLGPVRKALDVFFLVFGLALAAYGVATASFVRS